jgi:hypothetical protein
VRSLFQEPCTLYGYPGADLVDAKGYDLPTHLQWGYGYLFGNPAKRTVTLSTGGSAYFGLEWSHVPSSGQTCPTASYLLVTPPDETAPIVVAVKLGEICGGQLVATPVLSQPF